MRSFSQADRLMPQFSGKRAENYSSGLTRGTARLFADFRPAIGLDRPASGPDDTRPKTPNRPEDRPMFRSILSGRNRLCLAVLAHRRIQLFVVEGHAQAVSEPSVQAASYDRTAPALSGQSVHFGRRAAASRRSDGTDSLRSARSSTRMVRQGTTRSSNNRKPRSAASSAASSPRPTSTKA